MEMKMKVFYLLMFFYVSVWCTWINPLAIF
jgi:hypothetical protein